MEKILGAQRSRESLRFLFFLFFKVQKLGRTATGTSSSIFCFFYRRLPCPPPYLVEDARGFHFCYSAFFAAGCSAQQPGENAAYGVRGAVFVQGCFPSVLLTGSQAHTPCGRSMRSRSHPNKNLLPLASLPPAVAAAG